MINQCGFRWLPSILVLSLVLLTFILPHAQEPSSPPNIILVMADDLGSEALGCYGGTSYATPRLDEMAAKGMKFDHGYAYPLCTPTRVSLMTGKYNFRNWSAFGILDPREKTFGHLMQDIGYKTCMVGKWQLQSYDPPNFPQSTLRRNTGMLVEDAGFDEYCMWHTGHTEEKGSRFADPIVYQNGHFLQNTDNEYGPDIYTDYLLDFISRNKQGPFFAYYPMALTHDPFVPTPDSKEWQESVLQHRKHKRFFADMVEYADKLVGRILDHLDEEGIAENTLVIFYSDNGTHQSISSMMGDRTVQGGKTLPIDAGTRVPLLANWKGKIAPGSLSQTMISSSDFLPTLFEAAREKVPSTFETDGVSFYKTLIGQSELRKPWIYVDYNPRPGWDKGHLSPATFVKGPIYKLYADGRFYDVENDALEETPLDLTDKDLLSLQAEYQRILDSLGRYPTIGYLERKHESFDQIVPPHTKIEVIATGHNWSEGPVWIPSQQCLVYSDVPENIAYRWSPVRGKEVFLKPSGYSGSKSRKGGKGSNGLALDPDGKLLLCRSGDREIARLAASLTNPIPVYETVANSFERKSFNSPNDLVVDQKGNIYFTDPNFGLDKSDPTAKQMTYQGVFRIGLGGQVSLLSDAWATPNGIGLSPAGDKLYLANSEPPILAVMDLAPDGTVSNERELYDLRDLWEKSVSKQRPDGMAINKEGIIFLAGPDGVIVISPGGEHLGSIKTDKRTSNCTFNEDESVLYVTCDDLVLRVILGFKVTPK